MADELYGSDLIALHDLSLSQVHDLLETAGRLKRDRQFGRSHLDLLAGKSLFMMFFNPSFEDTKQL